MHWLRARLALTALWTASGLACSKPNDSEGASKTTAPARASASAAGSVPHGASAPSSAPAPSSATERPGGGLGSGGCRVLAVLGSVTTGGVPVVVGSLLASQWVELEPGSSLALRHTLTSREFQLSGPGRLLPCRGGSEQVLLSRGGLSTSANLGVRPGAEVLIATPAALVRYGDAALDVRYDVSGLRVRVRQGEAWLEPERTGRPALPNPLRSGAEVRLSPARGDGKESVLACAAAAEAARRSAERVLGPVETGAPSLGDRAAVHVLSRQRARGACAIAAATVAALADPVALVGFQRSIAESDELWQRVPRP